MKTTTSSLKSIVTDQSIEFNYQPEEQNQTHPTPKFFILDNIEEISQCPIDISIQQEISFSVENIMQSFYPVQTLQCYELTNSQHTQQSEIKALQKRREDKILQTVQLKLLVVGQTGVGKTTFIQTYLSQNCFKDRNTNRIPSRHLKVTEDSACITTGNSNLRISFLDIDGYESPHRFKNWNKMVKQLITQQFRYHHKKTQLILANRSQYLKELQLMSDERVQQYIYNQQIHGCLYFINGPKISDEDMYAMKELSQVVSIIPILSRGDSYTKDEKTLIKLFIMEDLKTSGVQIYDCLESLPSNCKYRDDIVQSQSPPFAIVSSEQISNLNIQGRQYPWGICNVWNPEHSDLKLLHKLLVGYFSLDLIQLTEYYSNRYRVTKDFNKLKKISKMKKEEDCIKPAQGIIKIIYKSIIKLFQG